MPTTANMNLILPDEDGSADVWDTLLNNVFELLDAHDHTTGKGVKVPSAAFNINADVSWSSGGAEFSITDLLALDFTPQAATDVVGYASALFVNSDDANNLYFRNQSGTNVKLTDGSTLNVSITGGIGGDYSTVSALVDYDDANDTYRFRQETSAAVRQYAKVATADLILREYKAAGNATVPTNAVTLKSPAALAASYAMTWPAALPATQKLIQMDASGVLSATNVLATDENLQLQGTGYLQHGDAVEQQFFYGNWYVDTGSLPSIGSGPGTPDRVTITSSSSVYYPIRVGSTKNRVKAITVYARSLVDSTTLSLIQVTGMGTSTLGANTVTLSGATTSTTLVVAADGVWNRRTLTLATPTQSVEGHNFWLRVETTATGSFIAAGYGVTTDVP